MGRKTKVDGRKTRPRMDGRALRARRQRKSRRAQVLESALEAFHEKGYHATTITDIITHAHIARGTFYLYFESKRAVFEELLEGYLERISKAVRRVELGADGPSPADQIRANVERVVDVLSSSQGLNRILFRQAVGLDADFDRKLADFYGRLLVLIEGALRLGQQMGMVRPGDVPLFAACVLGSVKEVVNQHFVDLSPGFLDRETAVRAILSYNLHGLLEA